MSSLPHLADSGQDLPLDALRKHAARRTEEDIDSIYEWAVELNCDVFSKLSAEVFREVLCRKIRIRSLTANQVLFRAGEEGHTFYVVVQGGVCIVSSAQDMDCGKWIAPWKQRPSHIEFNSSNLLVTLHSYHSFGEYALQHDSNSRRTASAVAECNDTLLLSLSRGLYDECVQKHQMQAVAERTEHLMIWHELASVSHQCVARLAQRMKEITVPVGEYIFRQGAKADKLFFMISGRVALSIDGCLDTHRKLAECREGEIIGLETAVGSYNKYRMHAQAASAVLVGVLTRQDWQDLQRDKNPVCALVMREVNEGLAWQQQLLTETGVIHPSVPANPQPESARPVRKHRVVAPPPAVLGPRPANHPRIRQVQPQVHRLHSNPRAARCAPENEMPVFQPKVRRQGRMFAPPREGESPTKIPYSHLFLNGSKSSVEAQCWGSPPPIVKTRNPMEMLGPMCEGACH